MGGASVAIKKHTTASKPHPHILYLVELAIKGRTITFQRRFAALHDTLQDTFPFPPKRLFQNLTSSGWVDDELIAERKAGLAKYLSALLWSPEWRNHPSVLAFLFERPSAAGSSLYPMTIEDVLPSTLTRRNGKTVAGLISAGLRAIEEADPPVNESSSLVRRAIEEQAQEVRPELFSEPGTGMTKAYHISASYYPEWSAIDVPPENLDYSKFDVLFFGFVTPNASSTLEWGKETRSVLKRLVSCAAKSGSFTRIVLSVGGWEGSQWFSQACSTSVDRMSLVGSIVEAVELYGLHGVDIDWEFPNHTTGRPTIPSSPEDSYNLLELLKTLRTALGPAKLITAAVGHTPWLDRDGSPMRDVSMFAEELSFVNLMNYSVYNQTIPSPNSPLGNLTLPLKKIPTTAAGAIAQWKAAGFPAGKILLGLPLFGYVFKSSKTHLVDARTFLGPGETLPVNPSSFAFDDAESTLSTTSSSKSIPTSYPNFRGAHAEPAFAHVSTPKPLSSQLSPSPPGSPTHALASAADFERLKRSFGSSPLTHDGSTASFHTASTTSAYLATSLSLHLQPQTQIPFKNLVASGALIREVQYDGAGAAGPGSGKGQGQGLGLSQSLSQSLAVLSKGLLGRERGAGSGSGAEKQKQKQKPHGYGYRQGLGFTLAWDDESMTPFLYGADSRNGMRRVVITFDNPRSLAAKARFAVEHGLGGCFTWSLDQDDGYTLQNVIRGAWARMNLGSFTLALDGVLGRRRV